MAKPIPTELWEKIKETYFRIRSIRGTANELGLSKSGTEYALKQMGVVRFPRNRKGLENSSCKAFPTDPAHPRRLVRNAGAMKKMYVDEKKSIPEIASILRLGRTTVRAGLLQCGIKLRTRSQGLRGKPRPGAQGSKHRDWRGGVTECRKRARKRLNTTFVRPVMERDNFKCRLCGNRKNIVVHHVRGFGTIVQKIEKTVPRLDVEKFIDAVVNEHTLEDGITLCKTCHDHHHKMFGKDQDRLDI